MRSPLEFLASGFSLLALAACVETAPLAPPEGGERLDLAALDAGETAIVFSRWGSFGPAQLWATYPDGSRTRQLSSSEVDSYSDPAVSPDRRWIATTVNRFGVWQGIYLMRSNGSAMHRLVRHSDGDRNPAWSPDGTRIAFRSANPSPPQSNGRIYVINADGTGLRQLTPDHPLPGVDPHDESPSWSPDGSRLVFTRSGTLAFINADGSDLTLLWQCGCGSPAWSPDGEWLAFDMWDDNNLDVYVMRIDGTELRRLTTSPAVEARPRWSPDGSRVVFYRSEPGRLQMYHIGVDGTGETRVGDPGSNELASQWVSRP
jgi:Tol biopolymer transport system component